MKHFLTLIVTTLLLLTILPVHAQDDENGDQVVARVVPDVLNLRESPSVSATILAELPKDAQVIVLGIEVNPNDDGRWVFVQVVGSPTTGWLRSDFIRFPDSFNRLSQLPVANQKGSTTGQSAGEVIPGIPARTLDFANLRTGPELSFEVIRQLPSNAAITLVGRNANSVWIQVVVDDNTQDVGWLFYQLVDASTSNINSLPVVGADNVPGTSLFTDTTSDSSDNEESGDNASATVNTASSGSNPPMAFGVAPGTPANSGDGRINAYADLGVALVYCVDANNYTNTGSFKGGGIAVYHWNDSSVPFFASESQINATANGQLVLAEGGYALYIRDEGGFLMTGTDQKGNSFTFRWDGCNYGQRVQ